MEAQIKEPKVKKDKKVKKPRVPRKITEFRKFCKDNQIIQEEIRDKTRLSIGCIHSIWNDGKATESTVKLLYLTLGKRYKLQESEIEQMIKTFVVQ